VVSLSLQIAVNYANDYSDGVRGTDTDRVGPTRIVASGLATPLAVKKAAFISFFVAGVSGLALASLSSWWILLVGAIAIAAAWFYTGGKSPYGYSGFGEISVFVFFGLVATMGTFFVQTEKLTLNSFLISVPVGALSCSLLAINNIRDREKDALVGKRTLAVRMGDDGSRFFFAMLLLIAHVVALFVTPWALLTLAVAPLSLSLARKVNGTAEGAALIPLLAKTGQLQLLFALLLATSLWLA
jgi:1,4-dihydroxy-2-naphthoate octaprenyltransferase